MGGTVFFRLSLLISAMTHCEWNSECKKRFSRVKGFEFICWAAEA